MKKRKNRKIDFTYRVEDFLTSVDNESDFLKRARGIKSFSHEELEIVEVIDAVCEIAPNELDSYNDNSNVSKTINFIDPDFGDKYGIKSTSIEISENLFQSIERAKELAKTVGDKYVTIQTIVASILTSNQFLTHVAQNHSTETANLIPGKIAEILSEIRGGKVVSYKSGYIESKSISNLTMSLTRMADAGILDRAIGRVNEINTIINVIGKRKQNNPLLVGPPGVGKTSIVHELAYLSAVAKEGSFLHKRDVLRLNVGAILAEPSPGSIIAGIIDELSIEPNKYILFIDEGHILSDPKISNLLKPKLETGVPVIMSTTKKEYLEYIEDDQAFSRRFHKIDVVEPSIDDTISMIRGIKSVYEDYHGVSITDNAIVSAVNVAKRYMSKKLPASAISLIDSTMSKSKNRDIDPPQIVDVRDRILTMKQGIEAKIEDGSSVKKDVKKLEELEMYLDRLEKKWELDKKELQKINQKENKVNEVKSEIESLIESGRSSAVKSKTKELNELRVELRKLRDSYDGMMEFTVTNNGILNTASGITGIPLSRITTSEDKNRILNIADSLKKSVFGQDKIIDTVSDCLIINTSGIIIRTAPIGSFIFLGPTGVGKTFMAKKIAEEVFGSESNMTTIDMSEYMSQHNVSRLIGSPPGYVGHSEGGQLTNSVKNKPYQVVLFDEIEKAHPKVLDILLQVLDEGKLTDGKGETVDFKNTLIIMTSNLGVKNDVVSKEEMERDIMQAVKSTMRPEFINRLDGLMVFNRLEMDTIKKIVSSSIEKLFDANKVAITVEDSALNKLAEDGFSQVFGARPILREIKSQIAPKVARAFIEKSKPGSVFNALVRVENGNYKVLIK